MLDNVITRMPMRLLRRPHPRVHVLDADISRYQKRISGALLDRVDIHIEVPRVDYDKLTDNRLGETSEAIRARLE